MLESSQRGRRRSRKARGGAEDDESDGSIRRSWTGKKGRGRCFDALPVAWSGEEDVDEAAELLDTSGRREGGCGYGNYERR